MKQLLILLIGLILFTIAIPSLTAVADTYKEPIAAKQIPDEAIRLRILANSDSEEDQELKRKIRDEVNAQITEWVKDISEIEAARTMIEEKTEAIEQTVQRVLDQAGVTENFTVEYGENINFPAKLYGSYFYPAGKYEAVLITIGEGEGANWWCVLFPPLCFLDFSNGTSVAEAEANADAEPKDVTEEPASEKPKVKFFFMEWFR